MSGMAEASTKQAGFSLRGHNPDVLTCVANHSDDEVFTLPELADRMLERQERDLAPFPLKHLRQLADSRKPHSPT